MRLQKSHAKYAIMLQTLKNVEIHVKNALTLRKRDRQSDHVLARCYGASGQCDVDWGTRTGVHPQRLHQRGRGEVEHCPRVQQSTCPPRPHVHIELQHGGGLQGG